MFSYKVVQCQNLLDPGNDTLLNGHIRDPQQLQAYRSSSKPIRRFVVIDERVNIFYGTQVANYFAAMNVLCKLLPLPTAEENKSMELVMRILDEVHKFGIDRRAAPIIAIGGGVSGHCGRRTPYIRVPTTLLSYIDASVGAKTGVNFANCKNKLGSYIPPTLPRRHISNGLAEMLKMALMKHKGLLELLESHGRFLLDSRFQSSNEITDHVDAAATSTKMAIETMLEELAPNLWEDDLDRLVDFGHLISPELEMAVLPTLLHGEAVNIDMSFMLYVSRERGFLTAEETRRVVRCMLTLELPVWHQDCTLDPVRSSLGEGLRHSGGPLRMPLPTGLGCAELFNDTSDETLQQAFERWCEELGERQPEGAQAVTLHVL
ncbi:pentafunctional AROM polypeptide-like [Scleropages formosus]|uniref:Pentafunctional AROM polypeptide-like n=1 Tax=Scleropages formosus TaxID=113540 RepID=A0A0P7ULU7_SCLFO|nr:pentafunctional AROM polypeptide-like [Scleropages formosus]